MLGYLAEFLFRGYETALRLHTPEATLASCPGLRGGQVYLPCELIRILTNIIILGTQYNSAAKDPY